MDSAASSKDSNGDFQDFDLRLVILLGLFCFAGLLFYYWPMLSGAADVYFSDLTYFFEPFCRFVRKSYEQGILPLWNPLIFAGMPQIAMPSPGLTYPFSWFMFTLPFSCGLACYMIFHQALAGLGSYLYFRDIKASRAASVFGAIAVCLCAYNFSFIRNCTLSASMAWLPISLFFERNIQFGEGKHPLRNAIGLAICVSMMMHVGRPEVGAPELLLLGFASVSRPLLFVFTRGKEAAQWRNCFCKLSSLVLGIGLSLPTIIPGVEWTALSTRAQGMALKWVFTWSANWYDFLGMVLASPLGDLCRLDQHTAGLRKMVLSRGGFIPFLSSAYVSPLVVTLAIYGFLEPRNRLKLTCIALLVGFSLMAAGGYTPFAPALVGLSPYLAAFRYPVKLMYFPCMLVILLAVRGLDLIFHGKIPRKVIIVTGSIWLAVFLFAIPLGFFPQIGQAATKIPFLFHGVPQANILRDAQFMMARSLQAACILGLLCCWMSHLAQSGKLKAPFIASVYAVSLVVCLVQSSLVIENYTKGGFYEQPSEVATKIKQFNMLSVQELQQRPERRRLAGSEKDPSPDPKLKKPLPPQSTSESTHCNAFRVVNLYFDPLSIAKGYKKLPSNTETEAFFHYARELLLYQTIMDFDLASSHGYEAAETADYKSCFGEAFRASCQHVLDPPDKRKDKISDAPIHRFCSLTATKYANTQIYKNHPFHRELPVLDSRYFHLLDENREKNFRIYLVKDARPRAYFAGKLVFVESFKDLQTVINDKEGKPQSQALDTSPDISYFLNRDKKAHADQFQAIESASATPDDARTSGLYPNASATAHDQIDIVADNGQQIDMNIASDTDRVLILADHYYPGWVAELDGKEIEILKANLLNRAVLVPAGRHHLRFAYRPRSLWLGIVGAAGSMLAFLLFYFGLTYFGARRKQSVPQ